MSSRALILNAKLRKGKIPGNISGPFFVKRSARKLLHRYVMKFAHALSVYKSYSQIDDEWVLDLRQNILLVLDVFNLFKSDHFSYIHYF